MYGLVVSISAAAARTYYTSYSGSERLKNSGKYKDKCAQQRRRNRLVRVCITLYTYLSFSLHILLIQKLKFRKIALQKSSAISEKDKTPWRECLVEELVSSEESDEDGAFVIHPLPWRSEKVTTFFTSLNRKGDRRKSRKSKMMTFERKTGFMSDRARPCPGSVPDWALRPL